MNLKYKPPLNLEKKPLSFSLPKEFYYQRAYIYTVFGFLLQNYKIARRDRKLRTSTLSSLHSWLSFFKSCKLGPNACLKVLRTLQKWKTKLSFSAGCHVHFDIRSTYDATFILHFGISVTQGCILNTTVSDAWVRYVKTKVRDEGDTVIWPIKGCFAFTHQAEPHVALHDLVLFVLKKRTTDKKFSLVFPKPWKLSRTRSIKQKTTSVVGSQNSSNSILTLSQVLVKA